MLTGRIRAQAVLLSVIPLAFLLLLLGLTIVLQWQTQDAAWWAEHSALVLNASDAVDNTLSDANTGVVSYLTTHRASGLARYRAARARMPAQLESLERIVADNPEQEARARRIASGTLSALQLLQQYLQLVQAGRMREAQTLDASPKTRALANDLAAAKAEFTRAERGLAIERFRSLRRSLGIFAAAVITFTLIGILITLLTTGRFGLRLAQRLVQLADNARVLGEGGNPALMGGNDEIADLDRVYQAMARRLRQEHHVASTLQRALLPQQIASLPGFEISTAYSPASEGADIGGDWYDAFPLSEELLALNVGDVAGSGLQAATIMGAVRQAMRTAARENPDPSVVFGIVNRMVCAEGWLVSGFFAVLDVRDRRLFYSSAGHPPPLLVSGDGEVRPLEADGLLLGVDPSAEFRTCEAALPENAMIVLYTDGLIEAERDLLKGASLLQAIVSGRQVRESKEPAREIQRLVFERVRQRDDSAILTVRALSQAAQPRTAWTFDATDPHAARRVRAEMVKFIASQNPQSDSSLAELVFGELAGNIAKHSGGPAKFSIERRDGCVVLRISDRGKAFDYNLRTHMDPFAEEGRGLFLVHTLARKMQIEHEDGWNTVTVLLPLHPDY